MDKKAAVNDFLGRVMAHSFYQELDEIEKVAGTTLLARGANLARRGATALKKGVKGVGTKARQAVTGQRPRPMQMPRSQAVAKPMSRQQAMAGLKQQMSARSAMRMGGKPFASPAKNPYKRMGQPLPKPGRQVAKPPRM